jgi:Fe-S cluster assembly protein SufD
MKEPVLFKTSAGGASSALAVIDRQEVILTPHEKRFVFLTVKNEAGINESVIETKENSHLELVMLQHISLELDTISRVKLRVGKDSSVKFTFIQSGAKRAHVEIETEVLGSGANVEIRGLQWAKYNQKLSFAAKSRHAVPHTRSDLQVWCIANDEAHSIFNGVITIDKGAHHTEAYQKNKNLLLSDRATVDTFPKLFIWNHDVKCAHGSSVSQLEPDQFYYLQSRGIDQAAAEVMLLKGFMHQSFEWITDLDTKTKLEKMFEIEEEQF